MIKDFAAGINTLPALKSDLEGNPDDYDLNYKMARKHMSRYEPDKAALFFEKVLELDPDDEKGHKTEATYEIAEYEARSNQNFEPLKAFIASEPSEDYLAEAYSTLGAALQRMKENEKAVEVYEEALAKMPDNAWLNYSYASAVFSSKMEALYDKALERNERAKTLDPEMERNTVYNMLTYFRNTDKVDMMIDTFEQAIQKWPDSSGFKNSYASAIVSMEIESKYDYGIELMEKTIEENPNAVYMYYTLGNLYRKKGELEKAVEAMKKVVERYPDRTAYKQALKNIEKELADRK